MDARGRGPLWLGLVRPPALFASGGDWVEGTRTSTLLTDLISLRDSSVLRILSTWLCCRLLRVRMSRVHVPVPCDSRAPSHRGQRACTGNQLPWFTAPQKRTDPCCRPASPARTPSPLPPTAPAACSPVTPARRRLSTKAGLDREARTRSYRARSLSRDTRKTGVPALPDDPASRNICRKPAPSSLLSRSASGVCPMTLVKSSDVAPCSPPRQASA